MKKWSIWIIITIMALSLCGCRPEAGVGAGSEGADTGDGQAEAAAQNTEATDTEGEQADGQTTEQTADTADTQTTEENTETQPAENTEQPTENETETTTTTAEDPELRAEAERIFEEKGEVEYNLFCAENDIKAYHKFVNTHSYRLDMIVVYMFKGTALRGAPTPDFSCVNPTKVEEMIGPNTPLGLNMTTEELSKIRQCFYVYIENTTEEGIVQAVKELEKLDYVQQAEPAYIYSDEEIFE